ncbi:hypothetical protein ACO3_170009 [Thiomonas arsenitoxydans]|nr:hypothetical protein ACO3_170009 [Thiomonas arsenitoxydans]
MNWADANAKGQASYKTFQAIGQQHGQTLRTLNKAANRRNWSEWPKVPTCQSCAPQQA